MGWGPRPGTRNVSERRTIGHEGARPRSGATESASTPARRCAAREDAPPPVPRRRRLAKDVHVFVTVDTLVRRAPPGGEFLDERQARRARLAQLDDPGVRLEGIREGLPLPERDVEEPLAASRLREPGGSTLAVVEDVRSLVDHEVLEAAVRAEVFARHPAGGLLADADEVRGTRAKGARAN